jgi:hypothetical protein
LIILREHALFLAKDIWLNMVAISLYPPVMWQSTYLPARKTTQTHTYTRHAATDPHILAHVNRDCPDERYLKLKIHISELISKSIEYLPVSHVTL